jgi:hypothetical protein
MTAGAQWGFDLERKFYQLVSKQEFKHANWIEEEKTKSVEVKIDTRFSLRRKNHSFTNEGIFKNQPIIRSKEESKIWVVVTLPQLL